MTRLGWPKENTSTTHLPVRFLTIDQSSYANESGSKPLPEYLYTVLYLDFTLRLLNTEEIELRLLYLM